MMFTDRLCTRLRLHRVVTQTSGVVVLNHRTLWGRDGTQIARWKQKPE